MSTAGSQSDPHGLGRSTHVLWGKMMAGFIFGFGITSIATIIGIIWINPININLIALALGIGISSMVFSAMGILFASIPTAHPGEVIIPLNFVRIPLMFIRGMFIPLENMPTLGIYAAFISPLTHTIDLVNIGVGGLSFFGYVTNIIVLSTWLIIFLYIGQTLHKIIMKRE